VRQCRTGIRAGTSRRPPAPPRPRST